MSKTKERLGLMLERAKTLQERLDGMILPIHYNGKTRHAYAGQNVFLLECAKSEGGYTSNAWIGYAQAREMGGYIRKGASGWPIVVCRSYLPQSQEGLPPDEQKGKTYFQAHLVFNLDDVVMEEEGEAA